MPLSPLESLLFLVLLTTSACLFWKRFGPVAARIQAARPEPGYAPSVGLRNFAWEVLLQGKVIRDRPWPGIAHAIVFWGFLAFALITVAHFAEGVHLHLLPRDSALAKFYRAVVAVFAAGVAVSIAGLAVRRFVLRPRWLGALSPESGLIAALIFVLMVTYLLTFGIADESVAGRLNWWAHTLALLVFLPLIPRTKHLHLVLSPLTVLLKRPVFGQIPPLEGDEDFGLDTGKDLTQVMALQAYSCVECGRCTEHCPAANTGKVLNPKEIILGVRQYLTEHGASGEAPLLGVHLSEEAAFQCTTCGACEDQCPVGIQHLAVIVGLRRGAVNTGRWEDSHGTKLFLNLEKSGNAMGFGPAERQKFLEKHGIPFYDGSQEYCLWLGCMGSYDPAGQETVVALVRVLRHLGVTFGVLRKERCTGDSARRLGNDLLFSQLAETNIETLRAAGPPKLLSICPHCVRTMGEDWKECGASFAVEHHSEFLARMAPRLPGATREGGVVYHDPCYLGRYRDAYDEPRAVIAHHAGPPVEPPRTRHRSRCCGAGGGLAFLGEEKGTRVSHDRATELAATGAATVAAACPFCRTMFRDALASMPGAPQLVDVAQLAAASIPED
ncbi:MAG: (Fe-S)-binding protein [Bryobacterales bacterium]|nr:(Fe-S)-binding protein [Bryobacterales bacterium]